MNQPCGSPKETQNKILEFLKEECSSLKAEHQEKLQKRIMKWKQSNKAKHKLCEKIEAVLKIQSLDADIKDHLLSLQQEIKNLFL